MASRCGVGVAGLWVRVRRCVRIGVRRWHCERGRVWRMRGVRGRKDILVGGCGVCFGGGRLGMNMEIMDEE